VDTENSASEDQPAITTRQWNQAVSEVVDLYRAKGQLWIGRELYSTGRQSEGTKHLRSAVTSVDPGDGNAALHGEISDLANQAAEGRSWTRMKATFQDLRRRMNHRVETLPAAIRTDPAFVTAVMSALTEQAMQRYAAAVNGQTVADVSRYHDGRGLAYAGSVFLLRNRAALDAESGDTYRSAWADYRRVLAAWPAVMPPDPPVMHPAELRSALGDVMAELKP
jgi:hypothetical protein